MSYRVIVSFTPTHGAKLTFLLVVEESVSADDDRDSGSLIDETRLCFVSSSGKHRTLEGLDVLVLSGLAIFSWRSKKLISRAGGANRWERVIWATIFVVISM